MFYKEDDILSELKCGKCNLVAKEANIIPCGECLCTKCVLEMLNDTTNEFECSFCKYFHKYSENGFVSLKFYEKLMKQKAEEVFRSKKVEELKELLEKLKLDNKEFSYLEDQSEKEIKDYFQNLRNNLDSIVNKRILEIYKLRESIQRKIDLNENECIQNYKNLKQDKYLNLINEIKEFYIECSSYIKDFEINDKKINESLENAKKQIEKLKYEKNLLNFHRFKAHKLCLNENLEKLNSNFLGTLCFKKFKGELDNFYFKEINLVNIIPNQVKQIKIIKIQDIKFLLIFIDSNSILNLNLFNQQGISYKEIKIEQEKMQNFKITSLKNEFFVYTYSTSYHSLKKYNFNLECIKSVTIGFWVTSLCCDESNLYCLSESSKLMVYDNNNLANISLKRLFTNDYDEDGCRKITINLIRVFKNKIFGIYGSNLYEINWQNGKSIKSEGFKGFCNVQINNKFISRNFSGKNSLFIYDTEKSSSKSVELPVMDMENFVLVESVDNDDFCLFDEKNKILYD